MIEYMASDKLRYVILLLVLYIKFYFNKYYIFIINLFIDNYDNIIYSILISYILHL